MSDPPPSVNDTPGTPVSRNESDEDSHPPVVPPRSFRPTSNSWRSVGDVSTSTPRSPVSASPSMPAVERSNNLHFTAPRPSRPHRLLSVSVSSPQLCGLCEDYIVTPRCSAYQCSRCQILLHFTCSRLVTRTQRPPCTRSDLLPCASQPEPTIPVDPDITNAPDCAPAISTSAQPLTEWNRFQIAYWLTVVGLGRFVLLFLKRRVTGRMLLQLAPHSPQLNQVVDPFARQALRRAIMVLAGLQPCAGDEGHEPMESDLMIRGNETTATNEEHHLKICTFLQEVACAVCGLPLLGLYRQGYQCFSCGMIFHRVCKVREPLPHCSHSVPPNSFVTPLDSAELDPLDYDHLPVRLTPYVSCFIEVDLKEQPLDPSSGVPSFLMTCTRAIECLATESISLSPNLNDAIDLVSAYQQSASTSTLVDLHTKYANKLPSAEHDSHLDVVRLTQLLKTFLRNLPTPVIPESDYEAFCELASLDQASAERHKAVQTFLSNLPEHHRNCLLHVLRHFDFIWSHQLHLKTLNQRVRDDLNSTTAITTSDAHRLRSCQPISWLLVFRQHLIRPPWSQLLDLTTSMDIHLRALNVLFLSTSSQPLHRQLDVLRIGPVMSRPTVRSSVDNIGYSVPADSTTQPSDSDAYRTDIVSIPAISPTSFPVVTYPTRDTPPSPASQAENMRDLRTREWYWGDVTQTEVCEIMAGLADGFFLVRDASVSSAGTFTLVVRFRGENRLFRIYHRGDYFGVVDPPPPVFRLVSGLIDYYRSHTILADENLLLLPTSRRHYRFSSASDTPRHSLSLKTPLLASAVGTNFRESASTSSLKTDVFACHLSKDRLLTELTRTDFELVQCDSRIKELISLGRTTIQSKEDAAKLIKAHQKLQTWLRFQQTRLSEYAVLKERLDLDIHRSSIEERLRDAAQQIAESNTLFANKSTQYQNILREQIRVYARRRKLKRKCQEIRRALKDQGVPEELIPSADTVPSTTTLRSRDVTDHVANSPLRRISTLTRHSVSFPSSLDVAGGEYENTVCPDLDVITNRANWFVTNVTRDQAEELLAYKPPGTFLIRSAAEGQKLALSVRLSDCTQHCLIYQTDGRYGFVQQSHGFDSLEALVCYYHVNSLKQHNPLMTTTLRYPAFAPLL